MSDYTTLEQFYVNMFAHFTPSQLADVMDGGRRADDYRLDVFSNANSRTIRLLHEPTGCVAVSRCGGTLHEQKREVWALLQAQIHLHREGSQFLGAGDGI